MADMLLETEDLGNLLREHKGGDVLVLDLREMGAWTDFFVIATATSNTHLDGLERHVKEFCTERGIEILRRSRKPNVSRRTRISTGTYASQGMLSQEDEWRIIDLGSAVIHLMSRQAREFYDLERLYSMARTNPLH
jgi:ribosome-associated protein